MKPVRILHIIQCLTRGGASRSMIATAKYSTASGYFRHHIISLLPAEHKAVGLATEAEVSLTNAPDFKTIQREIEHADIVNIHFWNNPEIYALLRNPLPEMRLVSWIHIAGDHPPQIITRELVDASDIVVVSSPYTYDLSLFRQLPEKERIEKVHMIWDSPDFTRLDGYRYRPLKYSPLSRPKFQEIKIEAG